MKSVGNLTVTRSRMEAFALPNPKNEQRRSPRKIIHHALRQLPGSHRILQDIQPMSIYRCFF